MAQQEVFPDDPSTRQPGLSSRHPRRAVAGGLGPALATRGIGAAAPQEATPVPSTTGAVEERVGIAYGEADGAPLLLDAYLLSPPAPPLAFLAPVWLSALPH